MSFREKSAWISFVSILLVSGVYFSVSWRGVGRGQQFALLMSLVAALAILEVVLHIAIAIRSPEEARSPKDERERLIDMKATRVAFPVLFAGVLLSIFTIHLGVRTSGLAYAAFLACVVAQLVRFGAQIVYYRRGV
jgi:hypothetical protein